MARGLREIRHKMKAIKSTRQVTKAMELVAASKMRRAVQNAQTLRHYALAAWNVLQRVAEKTQGLHPYLQSTKGQRVLAILFTSDRGLCGSLHTQLFRATQQYLKALPSHPGFQSIEFIAVGRKGQQFLARSKQKVVAAFPALSNHPSFRDIFPMMRMAHEGFIAGTYDHVVLLYTDFISALVQEPVVKVLLPFSPTDLKAMIASLAPQQGKKKKEQVILKEASGLAQYVFEPSPEEVLAGILPQLTEVQLYQAVLEATASEHSARMLAMRNASDNAEGIIDDLTLTYNQTRQAGITGELAELSASKAALEA